MDEPPNPAGEGATTDDALLGGRPFGFFGPGYRVGTDAILLAAATAEGV